MAVLAAILPVVSRSSCLALELYQFAASSPGEAKDLIKVAKAINNFASILKQVGTIIKEDDRLPSYEVCSFPDTCSATVLFASSEHQAEWIKRSFGIHLQVGFVFGFTTTLQGGWTVLARNHLLNPCRVSCIEADIKCRLLMS